MARIKIWLGRIAIVSYGAFLLACSKEATEAEKNTVQQLILYSTHGRENIDPVLERFHRENAEIEVHYQQFSTIDLLNRVRAEEGAPGADLWWGGPAHVFDQAAELELLDPYQPSWADAATETPRHPQDLWYGNFLMPECIMYNRRALSEDEAPRTWDELLEPRWKGRIVLREPAKSGTMRAIFAAMVWRQMAKPGGGEEQGMDWLRRLHENVAFYAPDPRALYQALNTEESPVTVWNMVDVQVQSRQGYDFGGIIPPEGTPILVEGIAILRGAKNRDAAEVFYEWVTSPEVLQWQAQEFHRMPARSDIPRESLPAWMADPGLKSIVIDLPDAAEKEGEWMERFRTEIQSQ